MKREIKFERMKFITREVVKASPDKLFLFGDNYERRGFGGQAREMRGEPNAYGIATKCSPDNSSRAFFRDDAFNFHAGRIFAEIEGLKQKLKDGNFTALVIPSDGLGTGLAALENKAPKVFEYLQESLKKLAADLLENK